jgi:hypothetical protein
LHEDLERQIATAQAELVKLQESSQDAHNESVRIGETITKLKEDYKPQLDLVIEDIKAKEEAGEDVDDVQVVCFNDPTVQDAREMEHWKAAVGRDILQDVMPDYSTNNVGELGGRAFPVGLTIKKEQMIIDEEDPDAPVEDESMNDSDGSDVDEDDEEGVDLLPSATGLEDIPLEDPAEDSA